jgi:hypothetical protein
MVKLRLLTRRGGPYGSQTSRLPHSSHNRATAVRLSVLRAGRPLPRRRFLVLISVKRISRTPDHSSAGMITSIYKFTSPGIEPATCRLVAQCLNYRVTQSEIHVNYFLHAEVSVLVGTPPPTLTRRATPKRGQPSVLIDYEMKTTLPDPIAS